MKASVNLDSGVDLVHSLAWYLSSGPTKRSRDFYSQLTRSNIDSGQSGPQSAALIVRDKMHRSHRLNKYKTLAGEEGLNWLWTSLSYRLVHRKEQTPHLRCARATNHLTSCQTAPIVVGGTVLPYFSRFYVTSRRIPGQSKP